MVPMIPQVLHADLLLMDRVTAGLHQLGSDDWLRGLMEDVCSLSCVVNGWKWECSSPIPTSTSAKPLSEAALDVSDSSDLLVRSTLGQHTLPVEDFDAVEYH